MIGIILALGYALVAPYLGGALVLRGGLCGLAPFLVAQIAVMPMMGMPVFSGSVRLAMGSLMGHGAYGMVVSTIYGDSPRHVARDG